MEKYSYHVFDKWPDRIIKADNHVINSGYFDKTGKKIIRYFRNIQRIFMRSNGNTCTLSS